MMGTDLLFYHDHVVVVDYDYDDDGFKGLICVLRLYTQGLCTA
jgi:hypothetical protein